MFAQIVIGPPGSGKTTYCNAMEQFLSGIGRKVAIVNLDPANDTIPYKCKVDISELITLEDVMDHLKLGPNGGLIYCMEYLEKNIDWLLNKIDKFKDHCVLFDCPGQVELYTHNNAVRNIMKCLNKPPNRLAAVHLVDSHYCSEPSKFISVLLTSLSTMLQIELPHVNILSKVDLIEKFGKLQYNLDFYTEVLDMSYLLDHMDGDPFFDKFYRLNKAIVGVIEDYSLVNFTPLNIQDRESMLHAVRLIDKATGYIFGGTEERNMATLMSYAFGAEFEYEKLGNIQEKYVEDVDNDIESEVNQIKNDMGL